MLLDIFTTIKEGFFPTLILGVITTAVIGALTQIFKHLFLKKTIYYRIEKSNGNRIASQISIWNGGREPIKDEDIAINGKLKINPVWDINDIDRLSTDDRGVSELEYISNQNSCKLTFDSILPRHGFFITVDKAVSNVSMQFREKGKFKNVDKIRDHSSNRFTNFCAYLSICFILSSIFLEIALFKIIQSVLFILTVVSFIILIINFIATICPHMIRKYRKESDIETERIAFWNVLGIALGCFMLLVFTPYFIYTINQQIEDISDYFLPKPNIEIIEDVQEKENLQYLSWGDSEYYFVHEDLTWEEAQKQCVKKGGHLITFDEEGEYEAILSHIKASESNSDNNISYKYYIGGQLDKESKTINKEYGDYRWVDVSGNFYGKALNNEEFWGEINDVREPTFKDVLERKRIDETTGNEITEEITIYETKMILFKYEDTSSNEVWGWFDVPNDILGDVPEAKSVYEGKLGYICEIEK